jgi:hypothetical protein
MAEFSLRKGKWQVPFRKIEKFSVSSFSGKESDGPRPEGAGAVFPRRGGGRLSPQGFFRDVKVGSLRDSFSLPPFGGNSRSRGAILKNATSPEGPKLSSFLEKRTRFGPFGARPRELLCDSARRGKGARPEGGVDFVDFNFFPTTTGFASPPRSFLFPFLRER